MSKRSSNRAGSAARRGPLGLPRIADMRIRSKLGLILLVPLVVLVAVAGLRLYDLADRVFESDDMVDLVGFNTYVAELRYDLQRSGPCSSPTSAWTRSTSPASTSRSTTRPP